MERGGASAPLPADDTAADCGAVSGPRALALTSPRMQGLDHGAVAVLDALGIKGIWRGPEGTHDTSALATLRAMKKTAGGMRRYCTKALIPRLRPAFAPYGRDPNVRVLAFSDTIVVTATLPRVDVSSDDRAQVDALLVDVVCQCAAYVLRMAPQAARPLVYRGVVTSGDVLVAPPFFLGPAIDDAAELHEKADGAFVWLAPTALERAQHRCPYFPHVWESMAVAYAVPLKSADDAVETFKTIALSPFVDTCDPAEVSSILAGVKRAMHSADPRVARKRENTLRFLDHVQKTLTTTLR